MIMKRLSGLMLLTTVLLLILAVAIPGPVRVGAVAEPEPDSAPGGIVLNAAADTIAVSKEARQVQGCRAYEITLGITGQPPSVPQKVDVILAIDCSGSMKEGSPRSALHYAKEAAIDFAGKVLQNTDSRVAVVSYSYFGHLNNKGETMNQSQWKVGDYDRDSKVVQNFTTNKNLVNNAINNLDADGGTNTEAGFKRAKELMQASGRSGVNRVIVFLTDGVPTVSIGRAYGPNYPTSHNNHTRAAYQEAQRSHALGYQVFTVNLLTAVPQSSLWVSRDTMQRSQNAGYYETFAAADLSDIYSKISTQLNYSATGAVVKDKIPAAFELIPDSFQCSSEAQVQYDDNSGIITWTAGTISTGATLKYKIKARDEFPGGNNVSTNEYAVLTYTDTNGSPQTRNFPKPLVNVPGPLTVDAGQDREISLGESISIGAGLVVTGGTPPYTYRWTCDTDPGWSSTQANPTVSPSVDTTYRVTVTDAYDCSESDEVKVVAVGGKIKIKKVVQKGNSNKKFTIYLEGGGDTWCMTLAHGESATVTGLKPGEYQIREVVPMGYRLVGIAPSTVVVISKAKPYAEVTVTNLKKKPPGFHDDGEKKNTFRVIN